MSFERTGFIAVALVMSLSTGCISIASSPNLSSMDVVELCISKLREHRSTNVEAEGLDPYFNEVSVEQYSSSDLSFFSARVEFEPDRADDHVVTLAHPPEIGCLIDNGGKVVRLTSWERNAEGVFEQVRFVGDEMVVGKQIFLSVTSMVDSGEEVSIKKTEYKNIDFKLVEQSFSLKFLNQQNFGK